MRPVTRPAASASRDLSAGPVVLLLLALVLFLAAALSGCSKNKPLTHAQNHPPVIETLMAEPDTLGVGERSRLTCSATDADLEMLTYSWSASGGSFPGTLLHQPEINWDAPQEPGVYTVTATVSDNDSEDQAVVAILVFGDTGEIQGSARNARSAEPLAGVHVVVGPKSATSDEGGFFQMEGIPIGHYDVSASLDGYLPFEGSIEVKKGPNALNVTLSRLGEVGDVTVTVTNSRSAGVEGATCRFGDLEIESDAAGTALFTEVPWGSYVLQISRAGYNFFTTTVEVDSAQVEVGATLDALKIEPPTGLRATKTGGLEIELTWDPPTLDTVAGYRLYQRIDGGPSTQLPGPPVPAGQTSFTLTGAENSRYQFRISAVNIDGEDPADQGQASPLSNAVVLTPLSQLVSIPAGAFVMSDTPPSWPAGDPWGGGDHPGNPVLVDAFRIETTEVTNRQYRAFLYEALSVGDLAIGATGNVEAGGHVLLNVNSSKIHYLEASDSFEIAGGFEDHPVVGVTWYGTAAYAAHVGRRLPTEAEWEKAARGVDTSTGTYPGTEIGYGSKYPWGNEPVTNDRANYGDQGGTLPVVSLADGAAVHWGSPIYHLAGNVWEWCDDWLGVYTAPHAPPETGTLKVLRGGSWFDDASRLRNGARFSATPEVGTPYGGFRCAADP